MRFKRLLFVLIVFLLIGTGLKWLIGNAAGPPDDTVKAPGDSAGCATSGCHSAATVTNNSSDISLSGMPSSYTLGQTYGLTFSLSNDVAGNNGFEVGISTGSSRVGGWSSAGAGSSVSGNYWKHNGAQTNTSWTVNWTAPSVNIGTVTFYGAANKAGAATGGNLHFKSWSVPPSGITAPTGTPTGLVVTAISETSITFGWTDNSQDEDGFKIVASTGGLFGTVGANVTTYQLTGRSPNELILTKIAAYNNSGGSTSTVTISSYTLANPPTNPIFLSVKRSEVTISWSNNPNPSTTIYEISQSADNFATAASSPVPFSTNQTSTVSAVGGLSSGGTYYFKIRARNGDGITTSFSSVISTVTSPAEIIQSTGGTIDAGGTTVVADTGVVVTIHTLSDGTTQLTLLSTKTASVAYGNGLSLELTPNIEAKVVARSNSITLTSTRTIPITESGVTVEATSGTVAVITSADSLSISLGTNAFQNVQTSISSSTTKSVSIALNPPSGEIKVELPSAVLAESTKVRVKLPETLPAENFSLTRLKSVGIGVEIALDKGIQPQKTVPITLSYRESDISGLNAKNLTGSRFDEGAQTWTTLPSSVDTISRKVTTKTNHFSKFQLMAVLPSADISGVKVFPNPFRPSKGHTEIKFTNVPEGATVKIYTVIGQPVRELTADSSGRVFWDAKNTAGKDVASDMYLAIVEGVGGKKILKVGIQR